MAGWLIFDDGQFVNRCKISQKENVDCCEFDQSLKGFVKCKDETKLRDSFHRFLGFFLREKCPSSSFRPLPPLIGNGEPVDLLKLYFVVKKNGGFDVVSRNELWDKVGEDHGLGLGYGSAIKLIYIKYLDSLEKFVAEKLGGKGLKGQSFGGINMEGLLMKLEAEYSCFLSSLTSERKRDDGYYDFKVDEFEDKEEQNLKREEKSEMSCTDGVHSEVSDGQKPLVDVDLISNTVKSSVNSNDVKKCLEEDEEVTIIEGFGMVKEGSGHKRKRDCLNGMLQWIANVAKDPVDPAIGTIPESSESKSHDDNNYWKRVLSVREALFFKTPQISGAERFVWQKKQKMHPSMFEDHIGSSDPVRSSPRLLNEATMSSICNIHPRQRIPIGPCFQADVPEWTGVPLESDPKWLGTRVWPLDKDLKCLIERDPIGKGRFDKCGCSVPGSVECVRFHISKKRTKLKLELGSAYFHWNFDKFGEQVAFSWTAQEEAAFKNVVKENRHSFWEKMVEFLPRKTEKDRVSYYFNVFLLRRRGYQNRYAPGDIDSDDDETEFGSMASESGSATVKSSVSIMSSPKNARKRS